VVGSEPEAAALEVLGSVGDVFFQRPLPELAAQLAGASLFIGHDSGVSHLAAAVGTPSVLLFGPTDPAMWAPPGEHVHVVRKGADMTAIGVDDVLRAVGEAER
jgi:heptosyltransferase III